MPKRACESLKNIRFKRPAGWVISQTSKAHFPYPNLIKSVLQFLKDYAYLSFCEEGTLIASNLTPHLLTKVLASKTDDFIQAVKARNRTIYMFIYNTVYIYIYIYNPVYIYYTGKCKIKMTFFPVLLVQHNGRSFSYHLSNMQSLVSICSFTTPE